MNEIKVSIVIPVYNVELYIKQCIDSVIHQKLKELEIIIVNDCSTDNSGIICNDYATKDERITVIHNNKNIKQGLSRNKGIKIAKGEYIAFLDPDDWVDLDFYYRLYNSAKKANVVIAKARSKHFYCNDNNSKPTSFNKTIKRGLKNNIPLYLTFTNEHWSAIFKRELIVKNKLIYPDIRNAEDDVFLLKVSYYASSIVLVSDTFHYYRHHEKSTVSIRDWSYYESILQCFKIQLEFANAVNIEKKHYDSIFKRYIGRVKLKYDELTINKELEKYREIYFKQILNIIILYKYDPSYYLDAFVKGSEDENIKKQYYGGFEEKLAYRILNVLLDIKTKLVKMKSLFNVKK